MRISRQSIVRRNNLVGITCRLIAVERARCNPVRLFFIVITGTLLVTNFSFMSSLLQNSSNNSPSGDTSTRVLPTNSVSRSLRSEPPRREFSRSPPSPPVEVNDEERKTSHTTSSDPSRFRQTEFSPPQDSAFIVFYNLFIPTEVKGAEHAIHVLTEQMQQVASALRRLEKDDQLSAVLFYNLIGNKQIFPPSKISDLCRNLHPRLSCRLVNFYESASESVTLQNIYEFCQNDSSDASSKRNDVRVVYLHSKGSYHNSTTNNHWRRELTNSALHPDCLFPPDDRCDVCGASFYTRFSFIFPGNMWTAKCSYIRKLLPATEGGEYGWRKEESIKKFFKLRLWGLLNSTLMEDRIDYFGLGRYKLEHWIGSHASIQPCELHRKNATFQQMVEGDITPSHYEWGMGPRRYEVVGENPSAREHLAKNEDAQFREYFFLPGNLLKWFTLYGANGVPEQNSWIWNFFPAGNKWKELTLKFGEHAVEQMEKQSSQKSHSAFTTSELDHGEFQIESADEELLSSSNPPVVAFYHISFPEARKKEALLALKAQIEVLTAGQYDIVTRSYDHRKPILLYYSTAGGTPSNVDFMERICKARSERILCRKMDEFNSVNAAGETMHKLHSFCRAKPSFRVAYLTNQLPITFGMNKTESYATQKVRAYTTAATSKMCLRSRDTCNACGMEFYALPYNHFVGNMFAASCDYVNRLLPPRKFETSMNDLAGGVLLKHLDRAFTSEMFPFTPQNLGLDQYSIEHWIGSHPDFKPCDVAPVKSGWFSWWTEASNVPNDYSSNRVYDFLWSLAPRRSSAPPGRLSLQKERQIKEKDDILFREYYYLAGNLFRWYKLYNKAPSVNSWVWQWFPRGEEWREGVEQYGANVVEKLTGPFTDEGVPH